MNQKQRRNRPVHIRHATMGWVVRITHGYVPVPFATFGPQPQQYRFWEADRFIRKWLPADQRATYTIIDLDELAPAAPSGQNRWRP